MSKVKYYYDPDTLSYHKIKVKREEAFRRVVFGILAILIIMFAGYIGFSQIFESPKEKGLNRELVNLKLNYGLLSKKIKQIDNVLAEVQERDNTIYRTFFEANPIPEEQRKAGLVGLIGMRHLKVLTTQQWLLKPLKTSIFYQNNFMYSQNL